MGLVRERPWRAASLLLYLLRGGDQLLGLGVDSFLLILFVNQRNPIFLAHHAVVIT